MFGRVAFLATACLCLATPTAVGAEGSAAQNDEQIVFSTNRAQNLYRHALYSVGDNGKGRRLVQLLPVDVFQPIFSPDRRWIAFERYIDGVYAIFIARPDGSAARRVSPPRLNSLVSHWFGSFSPDGRHIAFNGYDPCDGYRCAVLRLFVVGVDGRGLREIANRGVTPSWSPDGTRIAFSSTTFDNDPVGAFVTRLADGRTISIGEGHSPVWAPRGNSVAFSPRQGGLALCVASGDGSTRRCIRGGRAEHVVWSSDGQRVAFQAGRNGPLAVADADGRRVRIYRGRTAFPLALSPKGKRVLYVRGHYPHAQLLIRNVDGRGFVRRFGNEPAATTFGHVRWAGRRISYVTWLDRNDYEIAVIRPDRTGLRRLTRNAVDDLTPAWSPDRRTIVFARTVSRGFNERAVLRLMAADGSRDRALTATGAWLDTNPAWSPDGRHIAFVRVPHGNYAGELMVVDVDTRAVTTLVPAPRVHAARVSWSPDGRTIVFGGQHQGPGGDLHLVNADGSGLRRLFTGREWATAPSWSPDGSLVAFTGTPLQPPRNNRWSIYVIRPGAREPVEVARDTRIGDGAAWSPDGSRLLFARHLPDTFDFVSVLVSRRLDGSDEIPLTTNHSSNIGPAWRS